MVRTTFSPRPRRDLGPRHTPELTERLAAQGITATSRWMQFDPALCASTPLLRGRGGRSGVEASGTGSGHRPPERPARGLAPVDQHVDELDGITWTGASPPQTCWKAPMWVLPAAWPIFWAMSASNGLPWVIAEAACWACCTEAPAG